MKIISFMLNTEIYNKATYRLIKMNWWTLPRWSHVAIVVVWPSSRQLASVSCVGYVHPFTYKLIHTHTHTCIHTSIIWKWAHINLVPRHSYHDLDQLKLSHHIFHIWDLIFLLVSTFVTIPEGHHILGTRGSLLTN